MSSGLSAHEATGPCAPFKLKITQAKFVCTPIVRSAARASLATDTERTIDGLRCERERASAR